MIFCPFYHISVTPQCSAVLYRCPPSYIVTGVAQCPRTYLAAGRPANNLALRPHLFTYFIIIMLRLIVPYLKLFLFDKEDGLELMEDFFGLLLLLLRLFTLFCWHKIILIKEKNKCICFTSNFWIFISLSLNILIFILLWLRTVGALMYKGPLRLLSSLLLSEEISPIRPRFEQAGALTNELRHPQAMPCIHWTTPYVVL